MNYEALLHMKSLLPKGYRELIAKSTGFSLGYIDRVFSGTRQNQSIVDAGLSILEDNLAFKQDCLNRLDRIIAQY